MVNPGSPGPSKGGIRAKALPLLGIGVVFAVFGAILLSTGGNRPAALILLILGLGDAVVAGALLVANAAYGKRFRK